MEPGSCTPYEFNTHYLAFLIVFLFLYFLFTVIYSVFRFNRRPDIFSEENEKEKDTENVSALSPEQVNVIWLAAKINAVIVSIFAFILINDSFCLYRSQWLLLLSIILIPLVLYFLEALISGIAARNADSWVKYFHGIARLTVFFFKPLYSVYESFKPDNIRNDYTFNEVEAHLREWVNNAPDNAALKEDERKMVRSILHFSDTLIREIMIPRIDMTAVDVETSLEEATSIVLASGHSRLPVYEDDIDNIIGVLYAKDLLKIYTENPENRALRDYLRPALFVPESKKAGDLLSEMQTSGIHMVIVVDEYGGTAGIVSMEDIVEEIVGEIRDEYDDSEEKLINEISENEYSLLGRIDLEDVNEILGTHITRESADTLAGFLYSQIGKVPVGDEEIEVEGWIFRIEELSGNRIRRVHVKKLEEDSPNKEGEQDEE